MPIGLVSKPCGTFTKRVSLTPLTTSAKVPFPFKSSFIRVGSYLMGYTNSSAISMVAVWLFKVVIFGAESVLRLMMRAKS